MERGSPLRRDTLVTAKQFRKHGRIAPSIENSVMEAQRKLKRLLGTLVNVETHERKTHY